MSKNGNVTKTDMSSKLKYYQNLNVTKTYTSTKQKCHKKWNVIKTEMSQNWNVPQLKCPTTEMSPKLKFHQFWIVTNTEISLKLKRYQNWNVTKHCNVLKIKIKIQEIGTDHLGLVSMVANQHPGAYYSHVGQKLKGTCETWHMTQGWGWTFCQMLGP